MPQDADDLPPGWEIAGWGDLEGKHPDKEQWSNVEAGGDLPSGTELIYADAIVVKHTDENGNAQYHTIVYGVDEWEGLIDAINDIIEQYG